MHLDLLPPRLRTLSLQNARVLNAHILVPEERLPRLETVSLYAGVDLLYGAALGRAYLRVGAVCDTQ